MILYNFYYKSIKCLIFDLNLRNKRYFKLMLKNCYQTNVERKLNKVVRKDIEKLDQVYIFRKPLICRLKDH